MISMAYDQLAKPFVSLSDEMKSFRFSWFFRRVAKQNAMARNRRRIRGARAADVARVCDSEMAPQAVGIARNGLGDSAAGSQGAGRENRSGDLRIYAWWTEPSIEATRRKAGRAA
jgi:hypothetical protein